MTTFQTVGIFFANAVGIRITSDPSIGKLNLQLISEGALLESQDLAPCSSNCVTGGIFEIYPKTLTIKIIDQNNQVLYENDQTPQYMLIQPNGPQCEPTCRLALYNINLTNQKN